ncbi:hypothetical protein SMACR_05881 [Sordaria macrospora]|uniref:WGS project CABT00000000 data, contig 2.24 n=2 Tax=Sordaria macrospora TaxID=5147 RepID=F7W3E1_SORMK|nr:uncharacterized protein SMAC_05881 [Sordaria macrospora k-hell]KAA8628864.1 hypothetical protein SMACR_05881 [Sordaria macrospora]KAH7627890.1 hypothetical protein B0T09DRAFT_367406 [Sordaria sp. MPI-SDFR-AT-0083]WPJ65347.1 hypothetical protein SMAC4_05881 [Sordaria macrospora]CCC12143.1 unnamed protein product [Sordaria macrospora k-hell]
MDRSNFKDIVPNMADKEDIGPDNSGDVIVDVTLHLHSPPRHRHHRRCHHQRHQRVITRGIQTFDEKEVNWRELSQPRQRRLICRVGLGAEGTTSLNLGKTGTATATATAGFMLDADENTSTSTATLPDEATSLHRVFGTGTDTGTGTGTVTDSHDQASQSPTGSNLRNHFAALEKSAVEASIQERIKSVETELDRLRAEKNKLLKELQDEMVDERWEEGVLAIDDLIR